MKRITNYALNCLINQGISKEHIKSLVEAIENQTRDNILTPEQAIEILLDGVIEEELHQQTVLDLNACCSDSALNFSIAKNVLAAKILAKKVDKALQSKKEADIKQVNLCQKLEKYITNTAYHYIKNSSSIGKYHLYIRLPVWTGITTLDVYNIIQNTCEFSNSFTDFINVNIYGKNINYLFTLKECETIFAKIISKVPSKFWDDCMVIYTLGKYYSIDHAAKEWFEQVRSRQKINLATVIFIAVAHASLAELVDAHSIESVEKSIEVRILELALQSSVIVCIRFINSINRRTLNSKRYCEVGIAIFICKHL